MFTIMALRGSSVVDGLDAKVIESTGDRQGTTTARTRRLPCSRSSYAFGASSSEKTWGPTVSAAGRARSLDDGDIEADMDPRPVFLDDELTGRTPVCTSTPSTPSQSR